MIILYQLLLIRDYLHNNDILIKPGGFLFVKVPKGTPVIPVDIIKEKEMTLNRGAKSTWWWRYRI